MTPGARAFRIDAVLSGKALTTLGLGGVEGMSREIVKRPAQQPDRYELALLAETVAKIEAHLKG